jgi:hypothetical protein
MAPCYRTSLFTAKLDLTEVFYDGGVLFIRWKRSAGVALVLLSLYTKLDDSESAWLPVLST